MVLSLSVLFDVDIVTSTSLVIKMELVRVTESPATTEEDMSTELLVTEIRLHKWKNHFYEMKGDVGMSVHEKERKQEDAYTKTQTRS